MVIGDPRGMALHVFHQSVQIAARVGDTDHSDRGAIPQAAGIDLSDRDVEMRPQPVFEAADYSAFVFERLRRFNAQLDGEKGDHNRRWPFAKLLSQRRATNG